MRDWLPPDTREPIPPFLPPPPFSSGEPNSPDIGHFVGVPLALLLARFVGKLLYQVPTLDPGGMAVTVALLALGGVAASLVPARRAARVDPLLALRSE